MAVNRWKFLIPLGLLTIVGVVQLTQRLHAIRNANINGSTGVLHRSIFNSFKLDTKKEPLTSSVKSNVGQDNNPAKGSIKESLGEKNAKITRKEAKKSNKPLETTGKSDDEGENYEEMETRPMFITIALLAGRLGNTLFQLASLLGIAHMQRMTPVMRFDQSLNLKLNTSYGFVLVDSVTEFAKEYEFKFEMFTESGCCQFDDRVGTTFEDDTVLYGYYQSWKYFDHIESELRDVFTFKRGISDQARFFLEMRTPPAWNMGNFTRVGLHIRRGDMNNTGKKQFGYTMAPKEYYLKAMAHFTKQFNNSRILFVVCTDDAVWSKENIQGDNVVYSHLDREEVDLAILSMCDHVIISTGSFSWWAGWFNKGQVVYYDQWPAVGSKLSKQVNKVDYFMEKWIPMSEG